jgi:hypothetical protein
VEIRPGLDKDQSIRRSDQGVQVDLFQPRLADDELAETAEQLLKDVNIDPFVPRRGTDRCEQRGLFGQFP